MGVVPALGNKYKSSIWREDPILLGDRHVVAKRDYEVMLLRSNITENVSHNMHWELGNTADHSEREIYFCKSS